MTVDKEYVANLAVTAAAKGKELVWAPGSIPLRDDGVAAHPAADLPQAAHLDAQRAGHRRPDGHRGRGRRGGVGGIADRHRPGAVAGLPVVESTARADHRRPGRLPGRLLCAGWLWRRGTGRGWPSCAALVFVSAFSVVTLGMPLGATKLYLFGISVDQQFRTEYLTRLTDSPALHDMTYPGLPPFYPPGWFWIGGRVAALTGTPAGRCSSRGRSPRSRSRSRSRWCCGGG